jgi:hypothetical protein
MRYWPAGRLPGIVEHEDNEMMPGTRTIVSKQAELATTRRGTQRHPESGPYSSAGGWRLPILFGLWKTSLHCGERWQRQRMLLDHYSRV